MKAWDRRLAVWVLVGTVAVAGASTAAASPGRAGHRQARTEHLEPGELGILPATLSFFNRLVEKAIAVVSPTPTPSDPGRPATPQGGGTGDNGAGIDPNG